jgi:glycosyltransferase involved in cell wall biosynthesis
MRRKINNDGKNKGRKRIYFLVSSMHGGGAERVASLLCNYWASLDYVVTLVPTFSGHGKNVYPLDNNVQLIFLADLIKNPSRSILINRLKRFFALRRSIISSTPDVIVSFLTEVNIVALIAAIGTNIPVIVSERTNPTRYSSGHLWGLARKYAYQYAKCVVVQTNDAKSWVETNCPNTKVKVIPNPIKLPIPNGIPILKPSEILAEDRKLLLTVGRLIKEKGYFRLIEAFAEIIKTHNNWDLVILGEGSERSNLEKRIESLGMKDQIILPGRVGNVGEWYQRADLFAMSSHLEGFPNALIEAMAYGVPVISIDCGSGPRDLIQHEVNGLLVSEENATTGLSQAIKYMIQNDQARERMSVKAKEVGTRLSIENVGDMWEAII